MASQVSDLMYLHVIDCFRDLSWKLLVYARLRRCHPPVRICKPKGCRLRKRDLPGVLLHHSRQGLCCPSRFCLRYPSRPCSPSIYNPVRLVDCSLRVPDLRRLHAHLVHDTRPSKKQVNIQDVKLFFTSAHAATNYISCR